MNSRFFNIEEDLADRDTAEHLHEQSERQYLQDMQASSLYHHYHHSKVYPKNSPQQDRKNMNYEEVKPQQDKAQSKATSCILFCLEWYRVVVGIFAAYSYCRITPCLKQFTFHQAFCKLTVNSGEPYVYLNLWYWLGIIVIPLITNLHPHHIEEPPCWSSYHAQIVLLIDVLRVVVYILKSVLTKQSYSAMLVAAEKTFAVCSPQRLLIIFICCVCKIIVKMAEIWTSYYGQTDMKKVNDSGEGRKRKFQMHIIFPCVWTLFFITFQGYHYYCVTCLLKCLDSAKFTDHTWNSVATTVRPVATATSTSIVSTHTVCSVHEILNLPADSYEAQILNLFCAKYGTILFVATACMWCCYLQSCCSAKSSKPTRLQPPQRSQTLPRNASPTTPKNRQCLQRSVPVVSSVNCVHCLLQSHQVCQHANPPQMIHHPRSNSNQQDVYGNDIGSVANLIRMNEIAAQNYYNEEEEKTDKKQQ